MTDMKMALDACPLVAILRGISPDEVDAIGDTLIEAGFRVIEVPLNSPQPLASIERLARRLGDKAVIGAGTVSRVAQVGEIASAGGRLIVMPHSDLEIVRAAKAQGLWCLPGIATPTEAFAALAAGADGLKLFPAEMIGPPVVKSIRAVLPREVKLVPVGGISAGNIPAFWVAGASAFGIGSTLYSPGKLASDVMTSARSLVEVIDHLRRP
ncbi:MAG: 2-dehydro-3-deoxy-6-phosphogalactonate aldolase [Hyphomicrobiaceae bacterium]